ncbi:MAG: SGNH/GDSL hydrolase family protein [Castellaniella sp.]|uniref:hypothetical protein n=1 Tax=Castellaniella sp. TaxID=1955812 RepID=UPI003C714A8A
MKKRLVVLSDSLGRPRPEIEGADKTELWQVYGSILQTLLGNDWIVDLIYIDSLDSDDAIHWNQRMVAYRRPDLVIYHLGINDCAPRLFSKESRSVLLRPWFKFVTRDIGVRMLSRYRNIVTRIRKITYVPLSRFAFNFRVMCREILYYSPSCEFIAVLIAMPAPYLIDRSYGYATNVEKYNAVLKEIFPNHVDVDSLLLGCSPLIADGIHLKPLAHQVLAEKIHACIMQSRGNVCVE